MTEILGGIALLVALYAAKKWFDDYDVRSAHKKISTWRYDRARLKHLTGYASFGDWLRDLPDDGFANKQLLARAAFIGAWLSPVEKLTSEPLARSGVTLYISCRLGLARELAR